MNITRRPETQRVLEGQLKTGNYAGPDELVLAVLDALNGV